MSLPVGEQDGLDARDRWTHEPMSRHLEWPFHHPGVQEFGMLHSPSREVLIRKELEWEIDNGLSKSRASYIHPQPSVMPTWWASKSLRPSYSASAPSLWQSRVYRRGNLSSSAYRSGIPSGELRCCLFSWRPSTSTTSPCMFGSPWF